MPISAKKNGIWNSGINFFKTSGLWKQINILFLKDEGVWKEADSAVSPVNLQFEVYGSQGQNWGINNAGNPPSNDPGRQGGKGGYTKVQMVIPTAYKITPYSFGGGTSGVFGGASAGFGIDGEWMVVAGGGAGAGGGYWYWPPPGGPGFVNISIASFNPNMNGSGGYNNSGSTGSTGSSGTFNNIQDGTGTQNSSSGSGGGGAPGGNAGSAGPGGGGTAGSPGVGGGGNIRIWKDQGSTSGTLNVNPEWSMTLITSSNGTSTGGGVKITNLDTNGTVNLSGDMPVEDLKNI